MKTYFDTVRMKTYLEFNKLIYVLTNQLLQNKLYSGEMMKISFKSEMKISHDNLFCLLSSKCLNYFETICRFLNNIKI